MIFPLESTFTIFLFDVVYFALAVQLLGLITGFNLYVFFFFNVSFFGTFPIDLQSTVFLLTVTVTVFFRPEASVIVIFVVPVLVPALIVQVPLLFPVIVTIFLLLDVHDFT